MQTDLMQKAKRYRWVIFTVLAFGYILVYFHRLCPAVLAVDMMRDLHTSGAITGLLGAAYFYPYALMQLPAGPIHTTGQFLIFAFYGRPHPASP